MTLPFGFPRPELSPGFLLWQTSLTWQRALKEVLTPFGLSHPQFVLMALLLWLSHHDQRANHQKITQKTLMDLSKLDKMTVSHSLRALQKRGLIQSSSDEEDLRAKLPSLTNEGEDLIQTVVPQIEEADRRFFGNHAEEATGLLSLLVKDFGV